MLNPIVSAAIWATAIFMIIKIISHLFNNILTRTTVYSLHPHQMVSEQLEIVLKTCYPLFPIEYIKWNGSTYKRGSLLRVDTGINTTLEGEFVGVSEENMLCLLTSRSVVAHELDSIIKISEL